MYSQILTTRTSAPVHFGGLEAVNLASIEDGPQSPITMRKRGCQAMLIMAQSHGSLGMPVGDSPER
jgi:hypothetical protein